MRRNKEKNKEVSRHHQLPHSRGGGNDYPNIKVIRNVRHRAIHTLFENKTTPEKIWEIIDMDKDILTEDFKRMIFEVLNQRPDRIFIKGCFKNFPAMRRLKTILKEL